MVVGEGGRSSGVLLYTSESNADTSYRHVVLLTVERGSAVVECRTRNRESQGSNPPLLPFRSLGIFVLFTTPQSTQLYK